MVSSCLRRALPVHAQTEVGSEERPRCSALCSNSPALETWRPVFLLLPLADGLSGGHAAAVCTEERKRGQVGGETQRNVLSLTCLDEVSLLTGCCRNSPALWSRTGGHGWRHTQVTLMAYSVDRVRHTQTHTHTIIEVCVDANVFVCVCVQVLLKADRRTGQRGEIAIDDVTLRQGACL